jgi:hypothetical protein
MMLLIIQFWQMVELVSHCLLYTLIVLSVVNVSLFVLLEHWLVLILNTLQMLGSFLVFHQLVHTVVPGVDWSMKQDMETEAQDDTLYRVKNNFEFSITYVVQDVLVLTLTTIATKRRCISV